MQQVGVVKNLFRFPVKSMQGEDLSEVQVSANGFHLDRTWAIRDLDRNEITGAKKIPALMQYKARYLNPDAGVTASQVAPEVAIETPEGKVLSSSDENISELLSDVLGKQVALNDLKPASDLKHYKLSKILDKQGTRDILGLAEDEPMPDFSELPASMLMKLKMFATPPGTYVDVYPIHMLTTGTLEHMKKLTGNDNYCVDRFRPNIFIDTGDADSIKEGFVDFDWCHRQLQIGEVIFGIDGKTPRCSMPGRSQGHIPEDKTIPRQMYEFAERNLGIYANVIKPGTISAGDKVFLLDDNQSALKKGFKNNFRKVKKLMIDKLG